MAWAGSYPHTIAIALDQFAAAVLFNRPDLTISSMAWMVANGKDAPLKLNRDQRAFLVWLGPKLDWVQANHMAESRDGDRERAKSTFTMLS